MSRSWKKHPVAKLKNDRFMKRLNSKLGRKFRIDEDDEDYGVMKNRYEKQYRRK